MQVPTTPIFFLDNPYPFTPTTATFPTANTQYVMPAQDVESPLVHQHFGSGSSLGQAPSLVSTRWSTDENAADDADREGEGSIEKQEATDSNGGKSMAKSEDMSRSGSSNSSPREDEDVMLPSPMKKPRITLPRGRACVSCRNRKLKCTGENPCSNCIKGQSDCRFEEVTRKKPRNQLLEERVAELEAIMILRGEALPPTELRGLPPHPSLEESSITEYPITSSSSTVRLPKRSAAMKGSRRISSTSSIPSVRDRVSHSPASSVPIVGNQPPSYPFGLHHDIPPNMASMNTLSGDIRPNSALELALINLVLPHTPFLLLPLHPGRFLALLSLPISNPQRPHPALLYILFSEAATILEQNLPTPILPPQHSLPFGQSYSPPISPFSQLMDLEWLSQNVKGTSLQLLERARRELDIGIRGVDRPFDLLRASIGIARKLYSLGRFIEGWNIPVSRLLISCGLHRQTGTLMPPHPHRPPHHISLNDPVGHSRPGSSSSDQPIDMASLPQPFAPAHRYITTHSNVPGGGAPEFPVLRMRPVILPPCRDEIDLAERVATFWAAKQQDWESGCGWGWTTSLADDECTTMWPWGYGGAEVCPPHLIGQFYGIRDLHDPTSPMHQTPPLDTTYVLAIKSLALLHRASRLFDLPLGSLPDPVTKTTSHVAPLEAIQAVDVAIRTFRKRIAPALQDIPLRHASRVNRASPQSTPNGDGANSYSGTDDPWWIMLHSNLYVAEMLMWKEMSNYQRQVYESAVSCARALVTLAQKVKPESWAHVDMIVAFDISIAARFLNKESQRLTAAGQLPAAGMASGEAEILRTILGRDYARYLPMAGLHSLIIQRVREGWPEKEGEYERV